VVLVDGTVPVTATRVGKVATNRSLEETLASFAGELSVVFTGAFVSADDTLDARLFGVVDGGG